MAHEVLMPKLSSTMAEGSITAWLKEVGDPVEVGDAVFEVMTDKIAIEVEAYEEGYLLARYIDEGESAPVNSIVAYIGEKEEQVPESLVQGERIEDNTEKSSSVIVEENTEKFVDKINAEISGKIRATPSARRLAREKNIALSDIQGSGPRGRIQKRDVEEHRISPSMSKDEVASLQGEMLPWSGMRRAIAKRMVESKNELPHVTMQATLNADPLIAFRQELLPLVEKATGERLSYLELIIKAVTLTLKDFPIFNAQASSDGIRLFDQVNLGIATALPDGLVVPVIQQAEALTLGQLTERVKQITRKAKENQLTKAELNGGTFTISSLGKSRVTSFTPIINPPEVAILGVGGIVMENRLQDDGTVLPSGSLTLSLSFDHRVVDGEPAAAFLSRIVERLESPMSLLI